MAFEKPPTFPLEKVKKPKKENLIAFLSLNAEDNRGGVRKKVDSLVFFLIYRSGLLEISVCFFF